MLFYDIVDLLQESFLDIFFLNFSNDEAKVAAVLEDVFVEQFAGFLKLLYQKIAFNALERDHMANMDLT